MGALSSERWAAVVDVDAVDGVRFQPVVAIGTA
jgi:hypothetical protein